MDYGKFKRDRSGQSLASNQTRVRPNMGLHDIDYKVKKAIGFLEDNQKVQVSILFRGREPAHIEEGPKVIEDIVARPGEHGKVEFPPKQEGRRMVCTVVPLDQ